MANSASMSLIRKVAAKSSSDGFDDYKNIGAAFTDVIDVDRGDSSTGYSLDQFLDSYLEFMKNGNFIYAGVNEPKNHNVKIWLDTSESNQ